MSYPPGAPAPYFSRRQILLAAITGNPNPITIRYKLFYWFRHFFPASRANPLFHRHPVESWLKYIYFMKIGQPKLLERNSQKSGLFVTPCVQSKIPLKGDDYGLKCA
jgi:hypothetical protein